MLGQGQLKQSGPSNPLRLLRPDRQAPAPRHHYNRMCRRVWAPPISVKSGQPIPSPCGFSLDVRPKPTPASQPVKPMPVRPAHPFVGFLWMFGRNRSPGPPPIPTVSWWCFGGTTCSRGPPARLRKGPQHRVALIFPLFSGRGGGTPLPSHRSCEADVISNRAEGRPIQKACLRWWCLGCIPAVSWLCPGGSCTLGSFFCGGPKIFVFFHPQTVM